MVCIRRLLATSVALIALFSPASTAMGVVESARDRSTSPEPFQSSAWLPYWRSDAVGEVIANKQTFTSANAFWWDVAACDRIAQHGGSTTELARLRRAGLGVTGTLTASGLTPQTAVRCLGPSSTRTAHVEALVRLARAHRLGAIDLDYEHLALTKSPRQARAVRRAFTGFVKQLCPRLDQVGVDCMVTVMPRWKDDLKVWRGKAIPWIYDYASLGSAADRLRVMAYDQHAHQFGPGPIAGFGWVQKIVMWSTTQIPRERLELGIPTYGRDFSGGAHRHLFKGDALALARRVGVKPRFDPVRKELTFRYHSAGVQHEVWFSDPRAIEARVRLARREGLAGVVFWAAGLGQAGSWAAVRRGLSEPYGRLSSR